MLHFLSSSNREDSVDKLAWSEGSIVKPLLTATYLKIPKISLGAYIFQRPFLRGLYSEGLNYGAKFAFQTWKASLIVGSKFIVFSLFYVVFEGSFPSTSPLGGYIWRGDLTEGFLRYRFGGLIFGGAYTWRGLFSEFYGSLIPRSI